jgi:hypothetical protein
MPQIFVTLKTIPCGISTFPILRKKKHKTVEKYNWQYLPLLTTFVSHIVSWPFILCTADVEYVDPYLHAPYMPLHR